VLKLHQYLWGKQQAWDEIVVNAEVDSEIPDLVPTEETSLEETESSDTSTQEPRDTPFFIDLRACLGWEDNYEMLGLLHPYFLVREEYLELDQYLADHPSWGPILVIGQPGIGEPAFSMLNSNGYQWALLFGSGMTIYLTYCLVKRLVAGQPTIFAVSDRDCYAFRDNGVFWTSSSTYQRRTTIDDNVLVLCDLNSRQPQPVDFGLKMLVVSSLNQQRYKGWYKYTRADMYVMKTWAWEEIYRAR